MHSGCSIEFDSRSGFSLSDGSMGKNVNCFGNDMSSSLHVDKKEKDILIFCKGRTQGLDDAEWTAEAQYSINFSRLNRLFI